MEIPMILKSLIPIGRDRSVANRDFNPFVSLQREIDHLFDSFTNGFPTLAAGASELMPVMDGVETDKDVEITAELPGLEEKDVQINVADNLLTIRGEKKAEKEEKNKNYRMVERSYGSFQRTLELPDGVDADAIKATIAKGVLKVTVPKPGARPGEKNRRQGRCVIVERSLSVIIAAAGTKCWRRQICC
jgi:HSP20 family protein